MMTTILLITVLLGITAAVILMIYLIDKINQLEQYTIENLHVDNSRIPEPTKMPLPSSAKNALIGLAGKNLWDAMCGKGGEGISPSDMESARKRYEVVLHKHIEMIFEDGKSDAAAGRPQKTARNPIDVSTLRGVVNSWIPPQHASRIYKVGYEIEKATEADMNRLGSAVTESCDVLFNRTDLEIQSGFVEKLLGENTENAGNSEEKIIEEAVAESQ